MIALKKRRGLRRDLVRRQQTERRKQKETGFGITTSLIIEVDGAFLESYTALYEVYEALLHQYGLKGSHTQFQKIFGLPYTSFIWAVIYEHDVKASPEEILGWYRSIIVQKYVSSIPLVSGVDSFFDYAEDESLRIALVASQSQAALFPLENKQQIQQLELVVTGDSLKANSENIPNLYEHALLRLGTSAEETISIVASHYGAVAAEAAGMRTLFFTNPENQIGSSPKRFRHVYSWEEVQLVI